MTVLLGLQVPTGSRVQCFKKKEEEKKNLTLFLLFLPLWPQHEMFSVNVSQDCLLTHRAVWQTERTKN